MAVSTKNSTDEAYLDPANIVARDGSINSTIESEDIEEVETRRRQLSYRYFDIYDNFEEVPEWYLIVEALELRVLPGDPTTEPNSLNFTWECVSYD